MNKQNNSQSNQSTKNSKTILTITIFVAIAALVVGGGAYAWQQSILNTLEKKLLLQTTLLNDQNKNSETKNLEKQIKQLQEKNYNLVQQLENLQHTADNLNKIIYGKNAPYNKIGDMSLSYCTKNPIYSDEGGKNYPTNIDKYGDIGFLGELFTADDCGVERISKLFGLININTTLYTLWPDIELKNNPSISLLSILQKIGFEPGSTCESTSILAECKHWSLKKIAPLQEILKLKPYSDLIKGSGCINCG